MTLTIGSCPSSARGPMASRNAARAAATPSPSVPANRSPHRQARRYSKRGNAENLPGSRCFDPDHFTLHRDRSGRAGLKVEMIRGRGPATGTVVKYGKIGAQIAGQPEEYRDVFCKKLRPVTAVDNRKMGFEDGKGIAEDEKLVTIRNGLLLGRKMIGTEEAGAFFRSRRHRHGPLRC